MQDGREGPATAIGPRPGSTGDPSEARAVAELMVGIFRRDLLGFFPRSRLELSESGGIADSRRGADFRLIEAEEGPDEVEMFGARYRIAPAEGGRFSADDRRMVRAIGAVLGVRHYHAFQLSNPARLELYRGGSEDHYVAAFIEPWAYAPTATRPSRIAATILALRSAALSTYENDRVSTGALLIGAGGDAGHPPRPAPADALTYGVELSGLKSLHRLCDGERTLFLVDREGKLAEIIDVRRWEAKVAGGGGADIPCALAYEPHARATRAGGHVCLVLSPNQEIKLFAEGVQAFAFAHGRWRILDPADKFASWLSAVAAPGLARSLFQAALNLAEARRGALLVVVDDPGAAVGRLIAPHDLLGAGPVTGPPAAPAPLDPLARRALHYLARGREVGSLDPTVLEALASIDGALVCDRSGRLLAFGAILRHDHLPGLAPVEGARTAAAMAASRFGAVLKVSEDGLVSCFLGGARAWDL